MNLAKKNYYGLVGTNKDGEIISRIGTNLGYRILRGSSSDGGSEIFSQIDKNSATNSPSLITLCQMALEGQRGYRSPVL